MSTRCKLQALIYYTTTGDFMSPMLLQVKELLSRNLDAIEISHRLHINLDHVRSAIEIINQLT